MNKEIEKIQEIYSDVLDCVYGTKNRTELLLRLESSIKGIEKSNTALLNKLEEEVEKLKKEAMCNVDFDENCYNFAIDDIKSIIAKHKLLALSGSWSDESAEGVKREIAKLKRGGE